MTMKILFVAGVALAISMAAAHAENACNSEIDQTINDWRAIHLEPASKPAAISKGVGTHAHVQQAVDSMRYHLAEAEALCKEGKDHEALIHVNIIRAFLDLPEIQHPTDNRYLFDDKKG